VTIRVKPPTARGEANAHIESDPWSTSESESGVFTEEEKMRDAEDVTRDDTRGVETGEDLEEDVGRDDPELDEFLSAGEETEYESGPEWMFEEGEKKSKDPNYEFCPAIFRCQLLRLFTKHFCQHPFFPNRDGFHSSSDIRQAAVEEMYKFCRQRNLREVWGYFWANWYCPLRWKLWARSSKEKLLSQLRTTMLVENFWRQLKTDRLTRHRHPRLDHLTWMLVSLVAATYMQHGARLEDTFRLGRAKELTTPQRYFKKAWKRLAKLPLSGKVYNTNVAMWTCNCGQQKYEPHHLCKHLVQAVAPPPPEFFTQIYRRRVMPLYRHPCLVDKNSKTVVPYADCDAGSITDGDDHVWTGDSIALRNSNWRGFGDVHSLLAKRFRASDSSIPTEDLEAPEPSRVWYDIVSDEEEEVVYFISIYSTELYF
jgi:hypothetical protein